MLGLYQAALSMSANVSPAAVKLASNALHRPRQREPERELWNFNQYAFHPGSIAA